MTENRVKLIIEAKASNSTRVFGRTKGEIQNLKKEAFALKSAFADLDFLNTVPQAVFDFSRAFKEMHDAAETLEQGFEDLAKSISQTFAPALNSAATELNDIVKSLKEICNIAGNVPPELWGALIGTYALRKLGDWGPLIGAGIGAGSGLIFRLTREDQQDEKTLEAAQKSLESTDFMSTVTPTKEQYEAIKLANQAARDIAESKKAAHDQTISEALQWARKSVADGDHAVQAAKQAARDIALVTEQARAGLIETREVGLGVYEEWITAQDKWINEQDRAVSKAVEAGNDFANGWRAGLNEYVRDARNVFRQAELLAQTTAQSMRHSFSDFFFDAMRGQIKGFEDYLNSFVVSVQRAVADMAAQRMTGSLISGFSGLLSAKGNVFSHGQVLPFASGGVVSGPTLFPLGVMGEAGPEAILPLQRTRSGDLGVKAAGSDGGDVIHNYFALNISAMDTRSMSQAFDQHKRQIVGMVQDAYNRRGQRGPLR